MFSAFFSVIMDDGIFLSKMRDIKRLCEKYHTAKFSKFLDSRSQALLAAEGILGTLFGGYEGAERQMLGVFPDWQEADTALFPIDVLKINVKGETAPSHRQYLGTILSLGIERDKIGDILVCEREAYVFLCSDISEFVKENISKVGKCGVFTEYADLKSVVLPEKKFEIVPCVCASLRLDAIVAGLMNKSRNESKNLILSGKVCVNHFETQKTDFVLKEGDLLSIRGFGRAEIEKIGVKTRSDRIHITFKKYI
jgi:RNA-binding protein YlmH